MKNKISGLAIRSMKKLLFMGCLFVPLAYASDCALDAILFGEDTFWEQMLHPNAHEITIRTLFSVFILGTTWYGCHLIRLLGLRSVSAEEEIKKLQHENSELGSINKAMTVDMRSTVSFLSAQTGLIVDKGATIEKETLVKMVEEMETKVVGLHQLLEDLHNISK